MGLEHSLLNLFAGIDSLFNHLLDSFSTRVSLAGPPIKSGFIKPFRKQEDWPISPALIFQVGNYFRYVRIGEMKVICPFLKLSQLPDCLLCTLRAGWKEFTFHVLSTVNLSKLPGASVMTLLQFVVVAYLPDFESEAFKLTRQGMRSVDIAPSIFQPEIFAPLATALLVSPDSDLLPIEMDNSFLQTS